MSQYMRRKTFGTVDRLLVANDPSVDGKIENDGVLQSKWADHSHLKHARDCVIAEATATDFVFNAKCCRIAMTLVVCQSEAAEDQEVTYTAYGSNDGFNAENVALHTVTVIGQSEIYSQFDNEKVVNGVTEHFKQVRIEITRNGDPICAWVYLHRGVC